MGASTAAPEGGLHTRPGPAWSAPVTTPEQRATILTYGSAPIRPGLKGGRPSGHSVGAELNDARSEAR